MVTNSRAYELALCWLGTPFEYRLFVDLAVTQASIDEGPHLICFFFWQQEVMRFGPGWDRGGFGMEYM